jgi:hypothetical protein
MGASSPSAKRKPTEHRRLYMADLMRKRRAAAKALVIGSNPP